MNEKTYQTIIESLAETIKKLKTDNIVLKYKNERLEEEIKNLNELLTPTKIYEMEGTNND